MRLYVLVFIAIVFSIRIEASYVSERYEAYKYVLDEFDLPYGFASDVSFNRFFRSNEKALIGFYKQTLRKGGWKRSHIQKVLLGYGMSDLFLYVAMVESGFSESAISKKKAVGVWQFMPQTAKRFKLQVDTEVDERKDLFRATEAAIAYFETLYRRFGKWYLAVMAYNCGEGRLQSEIERIGGDSIYALLSSRSKLPTETKTYLMKIVALAMIGESKGAIRFGTDNGRNVTEVKLRRPASLAELERRLRLKKGTLKKLNPKFKSDLAQGRIVIPLESVYRFYLDVDIKEESVDSNETVLQAYDVRLGDTLKSIAERFGVSCGSLKRLNRLKRTYLIEGELLVIPTGGFKQ